MRREHIDKVFGDNRWSEARTEFRAFYSDNQLRLRDACDALKQLLTLLLSNEFDPAPKILGRIKDADECIKKFELKYLKDCEETEGPFTIHDKITDLVGLRIICIYESDISKAAKIIEDNLEVHEITDKTSALEIHENQFGYKGLHLDTGLDEQRKKLPEYSKFSDTRFEIQIRSIVQDAWSEVDHRLKYKKRVPKNLKRRINRLAALFELADQEFEAIRDNTTHLEAEGQKDTKGKNLDHPLTPFNFGPAIEKYFEGFSFEPFKVDGFVDEILQHNEDITVRNLVDAVVSNISKIKEYKAYLSSPPLNHDMNPFTQIRHLLYAHNNVLYDSLMRPGPKKNFDRWLEHGTVHPAEIEMKSKWEKN